MSLAPSVAREVLFGYGAVHRRALFLDFSRASFERAQLVFQGMKTGEELFHALLLMLGCVARIFHLCPQLLLLPGNGLLQQEVIPGQQAQPGGLGLDGQVPDMLPDA